MFFIIRLECGKSVVLCGGLSHRMQGIVQASRSVILQRKGIWVGYVSKSCADHDGSRDLFNQLKTTIFMAVNGYDELPGGGWGRELLERPAALIDRIFLRFFEAAEVISLTKDEKKQYVNNMINERDTYNQIAYAREVGMEEGMKKGLKKGMEKGMEKGRSEERDSVATRLLESGLPIDVIVRCTGLDKGAVEALCKKDNE